MYVLLNIPHREKATIDNIKNFNQDPGFPNIGFACLAKKLHAVTLDLHLEVKDASS